MATMLKYRDIELTIIDSLKTANSMKCVTYNDIKCDFNGHTKADFPVKMQEIQIIKDSVIISYGYLSSFEYDGFTKKIKFEVLSPKSYINRRVTNLITNGLTLQETVEDLISGLLVDGYSLDGTIDLAEISGSKLISEEIIFRSIDEIFDYLAKKYSFVWYVDNLKVIHIIMENEIINQTPVYNFTNKSSIDINRVEIESKEYFNKVYAKNLKVYYSSYTATDLSPLIKEDKVTTKNELITFTNWIDISENVGQKIKDSPETVILLQLEYGSGYKSITYNKTTKVYTIDSAIGFEGVDDNNATKVVLLVRDNFFKNIITGLKFKAVTTIAEINTQTALRNSVISYLNSNEIESSKNIISTSGIVENIVDLNNKWFSLDEINTYIKNLIATNSKPAEIVKFRLEGIDLSEFDNIDVGKTVNIINDDYFLNDNYVVVSKQVEESYVTKKIDIECRSASYLDNFINMFRNNFGQDNESSELYTISSAYTAETLNVTDNFYAKGETINDS